MLVQGQPNRRAPALAWVLLLGVVLGLGFWIGRPLPEGVDRALAGGAASPTGNLDSAAVARTAPPAPVPIAAEAGALRVLQIEVADADWQQIAAARQRALTRGMLQEQDQIPVPVSVTLGSESARGLARLKGDWLDHIDTDQWSLRFELERPIGGMVRFSVQHPKTRGFGLEWLTMAVGRREGLLAPRAEIVRMMRNGVDAGIYYLEEHFSKELLESQGRREGPIVRFDESAMWATWVQHGFQQTHTMSAAVQPAATFFTAVSGAFNEPRLTSLDSLNRRMVRALAQVDDLQRLALLATGPARDRKVQALAQLGGRTVEDLFRTDQLGKWLAVHTLFRGLHGLAWHNLRFYHDPVLDRLEPILFDVGGDLIDHEGELALDWYDAKWFTQSPAVLAAAFAELGKMTEPDWLPAVAREFGPKMHAYGEAMSKAGVLQAGINLDALFAIVLPHQIESLRAITRPVVAAGFAAELAGVRTSAGDDRVVDVDAWATTSIPTCVRGFRFANGRVVPAAEALVGLSGVAGSGSDLQVLAGGAVMLPRDQSHAQFRFAVDRRMAGLSEVEALKRAIRSGVAGDDKVKVEVLFRPLAEAQDRVQPLVLRRVESEDMRSRGRPKPPSLLDALARYPQLTYDLAADELSVLPGRHELDGDLIVPEHHVLHIRAGTELRFAPGAVLVAEAIVAEGALGKPIVLGPRDEKLGWGGLQVLGNGTPSTLAWVEASGMTALDRGGWQSSGGVTFLRSPVTMVDCTLRGARCEDSINVFAARLQATRCVFEGGPSDLIDGDFVTGEVVSCTFRNSGEDAIDVSGSQLLVKECRFEGIGDKCISVGEDSRVSVQGCAIASTSIGIAAKDRSEVTVSALSLAKVDHYAFAVYIKKPEFGPSRMTVDGFVWTGAGKAPTLAQTGCELRVNSAVVPTEPVDVEALYRAKVLGK